MDPDGLGPTLGFLEVPEGEVVKSRVRLDLNISDGRGAPMQLRKVNAKVGQLTELGGTKVRVSDEEVDGHYYVVMQDPEGNEFSPTVTGGVRNPWRRTAPLPGRTGTCPRSFPTPRPDSWSRCSARAS